MAKIQPGLERIAALLQGATFPWKSIHVAGTNGKGSICHYASSMLVGRSVKVGKFTSPHLVDRWDCITIDGKPVAESKFRTVENHLLKMNKKLEIGASPFEILTAAAFTVFYDAKVNVGIVEVGMGGKLDSTNILNNQAVSIISKIARDHEAYLGNTLSEIAGHKAGILRPNVPYIISPANEANVQSVIDDYARSIGAGPRLYTTSLELDTRLYMSQKWQRITQGLVPFQQDNLKLAVVGVMQALLKSDKGAKPTTLAKSLLMNTKKHHHGRQEMIHATPVFRDATKRKNHVLVDGAHNPDSAEALNDFVHSNLRYGQSPSMERPASGWPVTWVIAMTEGKDARQYLATLLKPGDKVVATTFGPVDGMPWVKPMDPKELLEIAKSVEPQITGVHVPVIGALRALCTAKYMSDQMAAWAPIALTGSLYLVGDLHRELRPRSSRTWWTSTDEATIADRTLILKIHAEERERVDAFLKSKEASAPSVPDDPASEEQRILQEELEALDREIQGLEIEEKRLPKDHSSTVDLPDSEQSLSAVERLELEDRRFAESHSTPMQIAAYLVRAEKAKEDLARYTAALEAAAKAREEKKEKRLQQKQRLEARRERRAGRKLLQKEQKQQRKDLMERVGEEWLPKWLYEQERKNMERREKREWPARDWFSLRNGPQRLDRHAAQLDTARPDTARLDAEQSQDVLSFTTERNKVLTFPATRADAGRRTWTPTPKAERKESLSASPNRDDKISFFGESDASRTRAASDPTPADWLFVLPNRDDKISFFGESDASRTRAASNPTPAKTRPAPLDRRPEDNMSAEELQDPFRQRKSEERAANKSGLADIIPPHDSESRDALPPHIADGTRRATSSRIRRSDPRRPYLKIHMHYAHVTNLRENQKKALTGAWVAQEGGRPGYHTPIKYYRHEHRRG